MNSAQLTAGAQKSCDVLRDVGPEIQGRESYITAKKNLLCVYRSESCLIRQHANAGQFPVSSVEEVKSVIAEAI